MWNIVLKVVPRCDAEQISGTHESEGEKFRIDKRNGNLPQCAVARRRFVCYTSIVLLPLVCPVNFAIWYSNTNLSLGLAVLLAESVESETF